MAKPLRLPNLTLGSELTSTEIAIETDVLVGIISGSNWNEFLGL